MEIVRIAELLEPFAEVPEGVLEQLQRYLDLLLRWNARINLTAVRDPEDIVRRHFGESLFAAGLLVPGLKPRGSRGGADAGLKADSSTGGGSGVDAALTTFADVGSGAGFPGVPIQLWAPQLRMTLLEANHKKATFLRELVRTVGLENAEVFNGRAEQWGKTADLVTLRAVEKFEQVLPVAASMVAAGGRLGLLIGAGQVETAGRVAGDGWQWSAPVKIPQSSERVVLVGKRV
jgi:16S rRNA (guanine527-N7)-methyltransferase